MSFFLPRALMEGPFRALFTTGNTGTDKVKTFGRQLTVTTDGVWKKVLPPSMMMSPLSSKASGESISAVGASPSPSTGYGGVFRGIQQTLNCVIGNQFSLPGFSAITSSVFHGRAVENGYGITKQLSIFSARLRPSQPYRQHRFVAWTLQTPVW